VPFDVVQVPVWTDNYAYLLIGEDGDCALVDSPEAGPILALLAERGLRLTHIFNTHHHPDHIGANGELAEHHPGLEIWGGVYDSEHSRIPGQTRALCHNERFHWAGSACRVLEIPGHTLGHIAYAWDHGVVFVGDTLFVGGCGRLFEGTPQMMEHSLYSVLGSLPGDSVLYCAHEYTEANLRFARSVDGDNAELLALSAKVSRARGEQRSTVPSLLRDEWAHNPFLRCDSAAIRRATGTSNEAPRHEVFGILRSMKDQFRG
jgi:hydroxyacylglutathione hydrolase